MPPNLRPRDLSTSKTSMSRSSATMEGRLPAPAQRMSATPLKITYADEFIDYDASGIRTIRVGKEDIAIFVQPAGKMIYAIANAIHPADVQAFLNLSARTWRLYGIQSTLKEAQNRYEEQNIAGFIIPTVKFLVIDFPRKFPGQHVRDLPDVDRKAVWKSHWNQDPMGIAMAMFAPIANAIDFERVYNYANYPGLPQCDLKNLHAVRVMFLNKYLYIMEHAYDRVILRRDSAEERDLLCKEWRAYRSHPVLRSTVVSLAKLPVRPMPNDRSRPAIVADSSGVRGDFVDFNV
ncbi:hypothetical protein BU16DRAFT_544352 [Lophium mytilinum]|uniref:Uncharacterized protein n=1 Tax=Lophium mytilinum TaxID=390894 RepID=A0A6A6QC37_9PEZI|nr:hypothetical protein BU16DRAFT_544352 [Lophium mytilinum]